MLNSETLEIAIGMAFLFLSVSLICTAIKEWLEGIFKWRAMDLERALRTLLADGDGSVTAQLVRHPIIDALFQGSYDPAQLRSSWLTPGQNSKHMRLSQRRNLPSYIPAKQFAVALLDCVARGPMPANGISPDPTGDAPPAKALSIEMLRQSAAALTSSHLQRTVLTALDHSGGDLAKARLNIERWFDGTMDRTAGWYKRRTQAVLFMLGIAVAAVLNIDALYVMQRLTADKSFREAVVNEAASAKAPTPAASATPGSQQDRIETARRELDTVAMPIGWRYGWQLPAPAASASAAAGAAPPPKPAAPAASSPAPAPWGNALPVPRQLCLPITATPCQRTAWLGTDWLMVLSGWLLTAFAVTLGAPFWFDVLNRFMVIRSTVKPHEKSPEEGSQDRPSAPAVSAKTD